MSELATNAMMRLRSEIAGKIEYLHEQAEQAQRELLHVDAVLHMLAPGLVLDAVKAKAYPPRTRPQRNGWARMVRDTLRAAEKSLTVDEIAAEVIAKRFNGEMGAKDRHDLNRRIENALNRLRQQERAVAMPQESGRQAWRLV